MAGVRGEGPSSLVHCTTSAVACWAFGECRPPPWRTPNAGAWPRGFRGCTSIGGGACRRVKGRQWDGIRLRWPHSAMLPPGPMGLVGTGRGDGHHRRSRMADLARAHGGLGGAQGPAVPPAVMGLGPYTSAGGDCRGECYQNNLQQATTHYNSQMHQLTETYCSKRNDLQNTYIAMESH